LFTNFFIDYIPLYNKFRAVSSIQVILELCIPVFAIFGLSRFFTSDVSNTQKLKALKISAFSLIGLSVFFLIFRDVLFDFVGLRDGQYQNFYGNDFVKALRKDRQSLYSSDLFRSLFFVVGLSSCLWFYLAKRITKNNTIILIGILIITDLVSVDLRYVSTDNFVSALKVDKPYTPNAIDKEILKDTTIFRVYDTTDGSTRSSYFHNAIGGYHAAKMRRFNEVMDFHINKGNSEVFNMLNTKYIIYRNDEGQLQYVENDEVNGNAWFVQQLKTVKQPDNEILALDSLNTKTTAVVRENHHPDRKFIVDSTAFVKLSSYAPNKLVYKSKNTHDGFVVFSENYYKNGWEVTIDGQEVSHYNVNYILRGIDVPKGEHSIVFEFNPKVVRSGSQIALISTILFIVLVLVALGLFYNRSPE